MRWDNRTEEMRYEVAIANALLEKARVRLAGLRAYLLETYGEKVRVHFNDYKQANNGFPRKRTFSSTKTCDDDIIAFIKKQIRQINSQMY